MLVWTGLYLNCFHLLLTLNTDSGDFVIAIKIDLCQDNSFEELRFNGSSSRSFYGTIIKKKKKKNLGGDFRWFYSSFVYWKEWDKVHVTKWLEKSYITWEKSFHKKVLSNDIESFIMYGKDTPRHARWTVVSTHCKTNVLTFHYIFTNLKIT